MKNFYRALAFTSLGLLPLAVNSQSFTPAFTGPITDNNTEVCFPFVVSGLPSQMDTSFGLVSICLDITHTYVGDLKIRLKAPDNTIIILASNVGGGGDNFTNTCLAEDGVDGYLIVGTPPYSGFYIPGESLNLMNTGINPNGGWELCIIDEVPADAGTFNSASLNFGANPPPDPLLPPNICSITNALGCECPDTSTTVCDLLPDMTASALIIQNEHTEYPGYLTLSNATPNIGYGPLEVRGINVCYCDTMVVGCATPVCPDGSFPKQLITQRIYNKNGQTMTHWDNPAGTMTYHPNHGHMHVDNWATYTLRVGTNDPDPLTWPLAGTGGKISFCLINLGSCSGSPGYCLDSLGNTLTGNNFPNNGLGGVSGCGNEQGIFVGSLDIYNQGLSGQQIDFPGICNGDYYIVSHTDPDNLFLEMDDTNNHAVVPITLTQQGTGPQNPSFTYTATGLSVNFTSNVPGVTAYQWYFGDGDSSNVNTVIHAFPAAGTYTVMLELYNGTCKSFVAQSVTVTDPVGINEILPVLTDVNVMPNPFLHKTDVTYRLSKDAFLEIALFNMLGEKTVTVFNGKQTAGNYTLALEDLPAGTYILKMKTETASFTHRIVKLQ